MKIDNENIQQVITVLKEWGFTAQPTKDQFCRYDLDAQYKSLNLKVECKRRRFASDKYQTTLINKDKYDWLVENKGWLVVTFDDRMILFKDLKQAFVTYSEKFGAVTTDFSNKTQMWSVKAELNINKAVTIKTF